MKDFHKDILAAYLYIISRYGYPPAAGNTPGYLKEFKNLGFQSIELEGIRKDHLEQVFAMKDRIREDAGKLGLRIPVFCTVLPGLCSADGREREINLELFKKGCEVARTIGSTAVLDNAPIPPWVFPGDIPVTRHYDEDVLSSATLPSDLNWTKYRDALVETFREVCDIAGSEGLTYHLHPCYGALVNSADAFLLFAEAVKRDNLRFNMDTANQFFMRDNLFLSLIRLKGHIDYIHLSDNRGSRVEHLMAGDGEIPWDRFFEGLDRIGYRGLFGIDIGGDESGVEDLDLAYRETAGWLQEKWFSHID